MKPLRPFLCRCLVALLPWAWTPHAAAAAATAAAKGATKAVAPVKAGTRAGAAKAQAERASPRPAGVSKVEAAKPAKKGRAGARGAAGAKASAVGRVAAKKRAAGGRAAAPAQANLDFTGRKRVGQASYYAKRFAGQRMADGSRMRLNHHNAASKTLPLGTIAKVTNLKTGRSAVVKIQDRGPFVKGRIVDLSPATARAVGLTAEDGVAPVEVTPIKVPMPDGSMRPGEAAHDPLARTQVARARDGD